MTNDIDSDITQLVADALDLPADELEKNKRACIYMTDLFTTSPHRGRSKPAMIRARVALAGELFGSLQRHEIDKLIGGNPNFAASLLATLENEEVQGAFDALKRECNKAVQNGGSERL